MNLQGDFGPENLCPEYGRQYKSPPPPVYKGLMILVFC